MRLIFRTSIFAIFILCSTTICALGARRERLIDGWQPLHYSVDIIFDDQLTLLTSARAEVTILILKERVTTIDLDFGEMPVKSVSVNGSAVTFEHAAGKLNLKLPQEFTKGTRVVVSIEYHGKPKDGSS